MFDDSVGIVAGSGGSIYRTTDGGVSWTQSSSPVTNTLYGSAVPATGTAIIVGSAGVVLRSADHGLNWQQETSGVTALLRGVLMPDDTIALAVGAGGTIIRSTDLGITWNPVSSGQTTQLYAAAFGMRFMELLPALRWMPDILQPFS